MSLLAQFLLSPCNWHFILWFPSNHCPYLYLLLSRSHLHVALDFYLHSVLFTFVFGCLSSSLFEHRERFRAPRLLPCIYYTARFLGFLSIHLGFQPSSACRECTHHSSIYDHARSKRCFTWAWFRLGILAKREREREGGPRQSMIINYQANSKGCTLLIWVFP